MRQYVSCAVHLRSGFSIMPDQARAAPDSDKPASHISIIVFGIAGTFNVRPRTICLAN